jgi:SAM-dependent methyltransferase
MNGVAIEEGVRDVDFDWHAHGYEDEVDRSVSFTGKDSAYFARRKVEVLEEIVQPLLGSLQELTVLDVGCGTGTTDQVLSPRVRSLHGVDVSEEMLARARRNVPHSRFSWYDGETLPFDDGTFDVVVAICVLHHVPVTHRRIVVNEMLRVTRRQGVVAVFEHNPYNPLTRHAVNTCDLDRDAVLLRPRQTLELLQGGSAEKPRCRQYLFSPLGGKLACAIDRSLKRLPLGGQYVGWVTRTTPLAG